MLLDKQQAAERLNICTDTLMTLKSRGDIIGFKVGGQWRFDERDIVNYIDSQRQQAAQRTVTARNIRRTTRRPKVESEIVTVWLPGMKIQDVCGKH